jgi:hypothetical protein
VEKENVAENFGRPREGCSRGWKVTCEYKAYAQLWQQARPGVTGRAVGGIPDR